MAKQRWTTTDDFVLDRWDEVRELAMAWRRTQQRMRKSIGRVGGRLEPWLKAQGMSLSTDTRHAEFRAYAEEWTPDGKQPVVALVVGGFAPNGYFGLDVERPYVGVCADGLSTEEEYAAFAKALQTEIGGIPDGWVERADWWYPVVQFVGPSDLKGRGDLVRSEQALTEFAKASFPAVLRLRDAVNRALAAANLPQPA